MRFSLFGAAPDTGNLGVTALCYATLVNILKQQSEAEIAVFDHGSGRSEMEGLPNNTGTSVYRQGAVYGRNFMRPENMRLWRLWAMFGRLGNLNLGVRTLRSSDAVIDISGGDSFTDLYGQGRFDSVTSLKLLALQFGKPLILLPQTYGPFKSEKNKKIASEIVKRAKCAWARDSRSYAVLLDLLGDSYDANRHRCGVDVAFGLPIIKPATISHALECFFEKKADSEIVGLNISGLVYNNPSKAREKFGFKADYNSIVLNLVHRFLKDTNCRIALVPHVVTPEGHYESDLGACVDIVNRLDEQERSRILIVPAYDNPCEIKWVIGKFDWFCGTRMHATIAALSSAVPVAAISYSPKTLGVFETCGQGSNVADPQTMSNEEVLNCLWKSWENRGKSHIEYEKELPVVKQLVDEQIRSILDSIHH